jgi:hypothetical protein
LKNPREDAAKTAVSAHRMPKKIATARERFSGRQNTQFNILCVARVGLEKKRRRS